MKSSPPKPATREEIDQFENQLKSSGPPKVGPTFAKLPPLSQSMRVWALSQPPKAARGENFLAEELQAMYEARAKQSFPLNDRPLIVLLPKFEYGTPQFGLSAEEWKRIVDEKRQQKLEFTKLSHNSKVIIAENSGHHIQLDEPQVVINAVRMLTDAVKKKTRLSDMLY